MLATETLPAWLGFSTLTWAVTGGVVLALVVALAVIARSRDIFAKALVVVLAAGVVATGLWYRSDMTATRRTCSTTLFGAQVRTPGCAVH